MILLIQLQIQIECLFHRLIKMKKTSLVELRILLIILVECIIKYLKINQTQNKRKINQITNKVFFLIIFYYFR